MSIIQTLFFLFFFLFLTNSQLLAQWNPHTTEAYQAILKWDLDMADRALEKGESFSKNAENQYIVLYLQNFSEAIRTEQNGTKEDWKELEKNKNERLKRLKKTKPIRLIFCIAKPKSICRGLLWHF